MQTLRLLFRYAPIKIIALAAALVVAPRLANAEALLLVEADTGKPARESASFPQNDEDIEAKYERWSTFEEQDGLDSTALYGEKGQMLKRYKGE